MGYQLTYKPYGERSVLVEWPSIIDEAILYDVLNFKAKIQNNRYREFVEVNHAYNSLLVNYNCNEFDFGSKVERLKSIYKRNIENTKSALRLWKIPVCYDVDFGIDLEELASYKNLSIDDIIKIHSQSSYTVYFIGFLPGFLYLGGLNQMLQTPRKATPRLKIEKGAVAIGGNQTGVYPSESPGGWNIIGNSPINFFDIQKSVPCFASSGDHIQFYPISKQEHTDIKTLVETGVYQIESEVIND